MNIELTKEIHNKLVDKFEDRAKEIGLKGKKKMESQLEFFVGACAVLDIINDNGKTVVSPMIWINAIRGEMIEKYDLTEKE